MDRNQMLKLINYHIEMQKQAEDLNEPYRHENKRLKREIQELQQRADEFEMSNNELIDKQRKYNYIFRTVDSILNEAIEALDNGEKVNGLEYAREIIRL